MELFPEPGLRITTNPPNGLLIFISELSAKFQVLKIDRRLGMCYIQVSYYYFKQSKMENSVATYLVIFGHLSK